MTAKVPQWHRVPTFSELVDAYYNTPEVKFVNRKCLATLNNPAVQQLIGNHDFLVIAAEKQALLSLRQAVIGSVARERGLDSKTLEHARGRRVAAGEEEEFDMGNGR